MPAFTISHLREYGDNGFSPWLTDERKRNVYISSSLRVEVLLVKWKILCPECFLVHAVFN